MANKKWVEGVGWILIIANAIVCFLFAKPSYWKLVPLTLVIYIVYLASQPKEGQAKPKKKKTVYLSDLIDRKKKSNG